MVNRSAYIGLIQNPNILYKTCAENRQNNYAGKFMNVHLSSFIFYHLVFCFIFHTNSKKKKKMTYANTSSKQ